MTNRSQWKNQFFLYESASKAHNFLRSLFVSDPFFKQLNCFQEVLVSDLVTSYPNNYDAVDWYIDELSLIVELHGKQHYKMQSFGSKDSFFNQKKAFHNIQFRDNRKKTALLNANYVFLEIAYNEKLTHELLRTKILKEIYVD